MEYLLANISHVDLASSKLPNRLEMEGMEVFRIHVRIIWLVMHLFPLLSLFYPISLKLGFSILPIAIT